MWKEGGRNTKAIPESARLERLSHIYVTHHCQRHTPASSLSPGPIILASHRSRHGKIKLNLHQTRVSASAPSMCCSGRRHFVLKAETPTTWSKSNAEDDQRPSKSCTNTLLHIPRSHQALSSHVTSSENLRLDAGSIASIISPLHEDLMCGFIPQRSVQSF